MRGPMRWSLLLLAMLAVSCRPAPTRRGIVVATAAGPTSLVPNAVNEEFTLSVLSNVYETLVDLDAGLGLRPGLAESWHSPDDLTWVFRLRPAARRHDGRILTAEDVALALEHARSHPSSRRRSQLAALDSIAARDERTLVLRTRVPFDPLPVRLSNVLIGMPATPGAEPSVGTGPFRVRSWQAGRTTVLEPFDDDPARRAPFAAAEFRVVPDAAERVRLLRAGQVDVTVDVSASDMAALGSDPRVRTVVQNGLRVLFLGLDTARETSPEFGGGANPFRDVRVRRAVALALDRERIVRGPLGGFAEVVDQIASPQELGGQREDVAPFRRDLAAARRLLAAAGWPAGFAVPFDYMPAKYRAMPEVAAELSGQLAEVGVRLVPRPGDAREVLGRIEARATAMYLLGWISDTGDGRVSYEYLLHSPLGAYGLNNGSGYSNPEVDRLIEESSGRMLPSERRALFARLAQIVHEEVPVVPLYRQSDLYAARRGLHFQPRLDRRIRLADLRWAN